MTWRIVVAGAGEAGAQAAISLREAGFDGPLTLVGDEGCPPYQRPPLSKEYLTGALPPAGVWTRPQSYYADHGIDLRTGDGVDAIDRAGRAIALRSGELLAYDHLVLALGARNRQLQVPGTTVRGVTCLRTLADAVRLRGLLETPGDIVVIGGGFVGLEVAATALRLGRKATVVEVGDRLMQRAVSPTTAAWLLDAHRTRGLVAEFRVAVAEIESKGGALSGVRLTDGRRIPAQLVVVGVGAEPNTSVAARAGLTVDDGVIVDEYLRTVDPHISAVGDCARAPNPYAGGQAVRLESIQNAKAQARYLAAGLITGQWPPYESVPWFWSTQGDLKLQIAGIPSGANSAQPCGRAGDTSLVVALFDSRERLVCVETVNSPQHHMAARRLLSRSEPVTRSDVEEVGDLRLLLGASAAGRSKDTLASSPTYIDGSVEPAAG